MMDRKALNLALLIGGFGVGQGSIFLAQTWLLAQGHLDLIALFGTHFSFAILFILIVDWGGITVLARQTAISATTAEPERQVWQAYWQISAFRLMLALVLAGSVAALALAAGHPFTAAYALFASPALLIWAFNATGIMDGLRISGLGGLAGMPPYILSGLALFLCADAPLAQAGAWLGGALSVGYGLSLIMQISVLRTTRYRPRWIAPRAGTIRQSGAAGLGALWTVLPGQLYFRIQLVLAAVFLGPAAVAVLVYAKQIVSGFSQVIAFMRRIEFPDLVARLGNGASFPLTEILRVQRRGTTAAIVSAALIAAIGAAVHFRFEGAVAEASGAVAIFAPTILSGALALSCIQGLNALGLYARAAFTMLASIALGSLFSSTTALFPTLAIFAIADMLANIFTIGAVAFFLRRRYRPIGGLA
jgi:hypothetical protein